MSENKRAVIDRIEEGHMAVLLVGDEEREIVVPVKSLAEGANERTWLHVRLESDEVVRCRDRSNRGGEGERANS